MYIFPFFCQRKEILHPNGKVEAFVKGEHTNIATRNARGLNPPMRERVVAMLKGGKTPIQAMSLLSDVDAAVRPLLSQIQHINKAMKHEYPDMDTMHAALVALQQYVVNTQEDWLAGSDTDLKILGILEHRRVVDGIEVVEPNIILTCRAVAGNVLPAMEAWGQYLPFRVDGTLRLTRM
jgi:hypothetical protein